MTLSENIRKSTVADFAYTIFATFNSIDYHLYDVEYKGKIYDCGVCDEYDGIIYAITVKRIIIQK